MPPKVVLCDFQLADAGAWSRCEVDYDTSELESSDFSCPERSWWAYDVWGALRSDLAAPSSHYKSGYLASDCRIALVEVRTASSPILSDQDTEIPSSDDLLEQETSLFLRRVVCHERVPAADVPSQTEEQIARVLDATSEFKQVPG